MAEHKGEQGTGKHPHRSSEDPRSRHESGSTKGREHESGSHSRSSGSESSDLKSREYKDEHGNINHHTHTAGKSKE
jgi:hypothetical protein